MTGVLGIDHVQLAMPHGGEPHARRALIVGDLAALVARLGEAGIRFKPGKPLEGYVRGDIADPFGNRIELMQRV